MTVEKLRELTQMIRGVKATHHMIAAEWTVSNDMNLLAAMQEAKKALRVYQKQHAELVREVLTEMECWP